MIPNMLFRRTVAAVTRTPKYTFRRNMSSQGTVVDDRKTADRWIKISGLGLIPVLGLVAMNFGPWADHSHGHAVAFPYMHIRNKKFPWGDGDTPLFILGSDKHADNHADH
eukprot:TRINITY_DN471_c0_g1_i2.p2 TRINITY_DN471_c0_g1~~TRINITY_DN471_c0_g1_i2.p2  ORF type:complete len:126 (+),score=24.51 TRINITY_DN471_c0_g1_i2:49-378(+)